MENDKTVQEREAAQIKKEQRFFNSLNKVLDRFRKTKNNILDTAESTNNNEKDEKDKTAFDILFNKKGWYDQDTMKKSVGYNTTREVLKFLSRGKLFKQEEPEKLESVSTKEKETEQKEKEKDKEKVIGSSVTQELTNETNSVLEKQGLVFTEIAANTLQTNVILNDLKKISDEQKELTTNSSGGILTSIAGLGGAIALGVGDKIAPLFKPITDALEKLTNISNGLFGKTKVDGITKPDTDTKNKTTDPNKQNTNNSTKTSNPKSIFETAKSSISNTINDIKTSASEKVDNIKNSLTKTASGVNEKLHSIAQKGGAFLKETGSTAMEKGSSIIDKGSTFLKETGSTILDKGKGIAKRIPIAGVVATATIEGTQAMENLSKIDALLKQGYLNEEESKEYKELLLKKQAIRSGGGIVGGLACGLAGGGFASIATATAGSIGGEAAGEYLADAIYGEDIKKFEALIQDRKANELIRKENNKIKGKQAYESLTFKQNEIREMQESYDKWFIPWKEEFEKTHNRAPTKKEEIEWRKAQDEENAKKGINSNLKYLPHNIDVEKWDLKRRELQLGYRLSDDGTYAIKAERQGDYISYADKEENRYYPEPVQTKDNTKSHQEELDYHYNKQKEQSQNNVAVQNNNTVNNTTIQNSPMITRNNDPSFRQNYNIGDFSDY